MTVETLKKTTFFRPAGGEMRIPKVTGGKMEIPKSARLIPCTTSH